MKSEADDAHADSIVLGQPVSPSVMKKDPVSHYNEELNKGLVSQIMRNLLKTYICFIDLLGSPLA